MGGAANANAKDATAVVMTRGGGAPDKLLVPPFSFFPFHILPSLPFPPPSHPFPTSSRTTTIFPAISRLSFLPSHLPTGITIVQRT